MTEIKDRIQDGDTQDDCCINCFCSSAENNVRGPVLSKSTFNDWTEDRQQREQVLTDTSSGRFHATDHMIRQEADGTQDSEAAARMKV